MQNLTVNDFIRFSQFAAIAFQELFTAISYRILECSGRENSAIAAYSVGYDLAALKNQFQVVGLVVAVRISQRLPSSECPRGPNQVDLVPEV